ncbi:MAG: DUF4402 domain-containing protein [Bdellovibrionota bacterium]
MSKKFFKVTMASIIALSLSMTVVWKNVYGANTAANALQVVIAALSIAKVSDLDFGEAPQGSPGKIVTPGTMENVENASFDVNGEPGRSFVIGLPANGSIKMLINGGGAPEKEIAVSDFQSFPSSSGTLGIDGKKKLFVGAARGSILGNQTAGAYSGAFSITVIY